MAERGDVVERNEVHLIELRVRADLLVGDGEEVRRR